MVAVPLDTPVVTPDPLVMVAIVASALLHTPPVVVLPRVVLLPLHTDNEPVMAAGRPFIVT